MRRPKPLFQAVAILLSAFAGLTGCTSQKNTSFSSLEGAGSASLGTETGNPVRPPGSEALTRVLVQLSSITTGTLDDLELCPILIRLFPAAGLPAVEIPIASANPITLGAASAAVATASIPVQDYDGVEISAENACGNGGSLRVRNSNGSFLVQEPVTLRFRAPFSVGSGTSKLSLTAQPLADALSSASSSGEAKASAESVSGSALPSPITFRQSQTFRTTAGASLVSTPAFANAVGAGNFMLCWAYYSSTSQTITSVTDSGGNGYWRVLGPIQGTSGSLTGISQELWYTPGGIAAGGPGFAVTAHLSGSVNGEKALSCHEYSGVDVSTLPIEANYPIAGNGSSAVISPIVTTTPGQLIFVGALFESSPGASSIGPVLTARTSFPQALTADMPAPAGGSYSVTLGNGPGAWAALAVSFKGN